ncbi:MAG: hypothetical protein ACR2IK_21650 [Chloroflexota bacterium]
MRAIAVDWSGDARLKGRPVRRASERQTETRSPAKNFEVALRSALLSGSRIWLAESGAPGQLARLEAGSDRARVSQHLLDQRGELAIGLDFGFSFPQWYLEGLGVGGATDLWAHAVEHGEAWLADCAPPFWGRRGRPRPAPDGPPFRRAELAAPRTSGIAPKSMFQIGGAGAVGTGSIRGLPLLHRFREAGARIWPFPTGSGWPVVLEIYPRLLTGPVRKSDPRDRSRLLAERYPHLDPGHRRLATLSEDAFDAAVSALVMSEHLEDLRSLPPETDPQLRLEGRIWHPGWQLDRP